MENSRKKRSVFVRRKVNFWQLSSRRRRQKVGQNTLERSCTQGAWRIQLISKMLKKNLIISGIDHPTVVEAMTCPVRSLSWVFMSNVVHKIGVPHVTFNLLPNIAIDLVLPRDNRDLDRRKGNCRTPFKRIIFYKHTEKSYKIYRFSRYVGHKISSTN